ncbi:uncharacterized protein LOC142633167 [Castanea sativa]|uniref:uncharacterized protein LOC142633167 n=1 Tax=Castanea sativa TaxID=21020 RepID=UPI003F64C9CF
MELWSFRATAQFMTFKELLSWLIKNNHQLELFAVTAWTIWNQWNQVRLNQPVDSLHQIPNLSKTWLTDYHDRQVCQPTPVQRTHRTKTRWRPPPSEFFKINFDGAVFPHAKKLGIGIVIRDYQGQVIASCSKLVNQELCSDDIEVKVASWAMAFALEVGVKRAVLEGDSLTVIRGLVEEENLLVPLGLLIKDAQQLSQRFEELLYSHVKRECNNLAHNLARHAAGIPYFLVWMEDIPPQFHDVLQADLLCLTE